MNHGRLDISTISLAASKWTFALPRNLHWPTVRATPPRITEPTGRYFIHCIQHWIVRFPKQYANRFRKYAAHELDQETILVDNHGQIYGIYALAGLHDDMGVRYFTIEPDACYMPLTLSQIDAVKAVGISAVVDVVEGEEGLPSLRRYEEDLKREIRAAIQDAELLQEVEIDPLTEQGIFESVGRVPMNPAAPQEPEVEKKRRLHPTAVTQLQQAYIDAQHARISEDKEAGHQLLASYLKAVMPRQFHRRIDSWNRTMLTRKLSKYYDIAWPKSTDKALPPPPPPLPYWMDARYYTIGTTMGSWC